MTNMLIYKVLGSLLFAVYVTARQKIDQSLSGSSSPCEGGDCGEEVCISDFLAKGDATGAREAILVKDVFPNGVESYSGFASVNETAKNKLFFWYVPPLNKGNSSVPLLIWLQV